MRLFQVGVLFAVGAGLWLVGTVYFALRGTLVLESGQLRYGIAFAVTPLLSALLCLLLIRSMGIPHPLWASAALLIAIPGMIGEAALLSNFSTLMPRLQLTSAGRYGAMLFATYALVLSLAEVVTLRAGQIR